MKKTITEIWKYKYSIYYLVARDLKVRYQGSALGFLWTLLKPFLLIVVYSIAFKYVIKIRVDNFSAFLFCGLLPWTFLSTSLASGVESISGNAALIKTASFPLEILPLITLFVNLFHFILSFAVFFPFLLFFRIHPGFALLFLPFVILTQTFFIAGLIFIASALNVYYRDVSHIVEVILLLWFWVTPIIYPVSLIPEEMRTFFFMNPFTVFIQSYRVILMNNQLPSITAISAMLFIGVVSLVVGRTVFHIKRRRFAEEV